MMTGSVCLLASCPIANTFNLTHLLVKGEISTTLEVKRLG